MAISISSGSPAIARVTINGAAFSVETAWTTPRSISKLMIREQSAAGTTIFRVAFITGGGLAAGTAFVEVPVGGTFAVDLISFRGTIYLTNSANSNFAVLYW